MATEARATTLTITLPLPDPLLTLNMRLHWRARARHTREQREMAGWAAVEAVRTIRTLRAGVLPYIFPEGRVRVDAEIRPRKGQKRCDDTAIWEALKPTLDGLEDAGIVANDKQFFVGSLTWRAARTGELVLRLTPEE
jgi:hypothetical protein